MDESEPSSMCSSNLFATLATSLIQTISAISAPALRLCGESVLWRGAETMAEIVDDRGAGEHVGEADVFDGGVHALAILAAAPAAATGLLSSASQPVNWSGFYVGGQIGGAWNDTDWQYDNANWFNTLGPVIVIPGFDMDGSGFLGGGQAGFNYQSGVWVFGVEGRSPEPI